MKNTQAPEAYLMLQDGQVYRGKAIGKIGTAGGEICFNTGMTGYQEIYTDPSYFGQIIVNTTSHIGNYGTLSTEQESERPKINGLVVNTFSRDYSRNMAQQSLNDYLVNHDVVGISEIDTRKLVRHIRHQGAMNAIITSELTDMEEIKARLQEVPDMNGLELASKVSTEKPYFVGDKDASIKIAVLDLGVKKSILSNFARRDCYLQVFPAHSSFQEMAAWQPDGYFISNGPGDPAAMPYAVQTVKQMLDQQYPVFGICLGHQILALACGVSTYKMHHGHRGINHPVLNLDTGLCEVTSQNHGFGVDAEKIEAAKHLIVTHKNLNDDTIEGIKVQGKPAFSVQYHPEASPGPHDSRYLFDQFVAVIRSYQKSETIKN
ncbi:MAG: glutamine-hydrolyzing carbamoyl-phosphate synthase small subunit [Cyclobacteriaceae bacterium]|nr:glutamine-hydrolyzing carbamoyl-phosphate synthase small subunit [Cyclobacteriaceae bacterium]